jgi:hypothetical protein
MYTTMGIPAILNFIHEAEEKIAILEHQTLHFAILPLVILTS